MIRATLVTLAVALVAACAPAASPPLPAAPPAPDEVADLVLTGGPILTMRAEAPRAEALAIRGAHVVAVGTAAEVGRFVGPATRVIDLHGRTVTPGLVDAHCHLYGLGEALEELPLRGLRSTADVAGVVTLKGTGPADAKAEAEKAVKVPGVSKVDNQIVVK